MDATVKNLTPPAVFAALLYAPQNVFQRLLGADFALTTSPQLVRLALKVLLGLGIARAVSGALNSLATNNWSFSSSPSSQPWDWPNERAVVTGGCSGIGLALVEGLTARGVQVAVLDIVEPPARLKANGRAAYFWCDVSSGASVAAAAAAARRHWGGREATVLVNNAGVARYNSVLKAAGGDRDSDDDGDSEAQGLRRVVGVNMMALWFTSRHFLPPMLAANKGHVVTIASLASFLALPMSVEYSATKAAALAFHEGLTCEIKHLHKAPGVKTTVIHPNFVRTPMTEPHRERIEATQPMLTVQDVTTPLLAQIFSGRGGQIVVPARLGMLAGIRGWPNWLQELLRDAMGRASIR